DAVAHEEKAGAMPIIAARLSDHIEDPSAGATQLGTVGVGGDAKFLDDLVAELIGGTIAAARLCEERVVVVGAVNQEVVLIAANSAKGQVAVGVGGQPTGILGYARSQQRKVGEAATVQRQSQNGLLHDIVGDLTGLGVDLDVRRNHV